MTPNFIKKNWQVLEAIKEGKPVQYSYVQGEWWDYCDRYSMNPNHEWRVKPETVYLLNNDVIQNKYGEKYMMMFFKLSGKSYMVPVRKLLDGMSRLIEPIECDDNDCVTLEEINKQTGTLGPFFKVET